MTDIAFITPQDRKTLVVVEEMLAYAMRELAGCAAGQGELSSAVANARNIAAALTDPAGAGGAPPRQASAN